MRVLHLANGNLFGGIEACLVALARLERPGGRLENHYLLSHRGRLQEELLALGRPVHLVEGARLRNPWAIHRARRAARSIARQAGPDVIVAHGPWTYVVFGQGLLRDGVPVGFFQHALAGGDLLHRLAARHPPSFVVANSEASAETTPRLFGHTPTHVCRCPVMPREPTAPRNVVRGELGAGGDVIVVQTSRFEEWKGHRLLLESLARLPRLPWQLWYVGGQSRRSEQQLRQVLERVAAEHRLTDRVRFLGERDDVATLLAAADIYGQPNLSREPYGIGLVEAMSVGLPIVATELGATADPVGPEIGRRVSPDPAAFASALEELIEDGALRQSLGGAARSRYERVHSPDAAVSHLADVLDSVGPRARQKASSPAWA